MEQLHLPTKSPLQFTFALQMITETKEQRLSLLARITTTIYFLITTHYHGNDDEYSPIKITTICSEPTLLPTSNLIRASTIIAFKCRIHFMI